MKDLTYQTKLRFRIWPKSRWARGMMMFLLILIFLVILGYSIQKGTSRQLVRFLADQSFPFEAILLEGMPGYSAPEREKLHEIRERGAALGMFVLTGVNITDARTYFFTYFTPPPGGSAWIGWAYNPGDPEFEGEILDGPEIEPIPLELDNETEPLPHEPISEEVLVGIYHTHNSESYIGDGGEEREEGNGEIVDVGKVIKEKLVENGVETVQALDIHDEEDFMMAYSKSIRTASKLVNDYPSMKVLLDIHRDGVLPEVHKTTVNINGKECARVMIVIGQRNPNWHKNEKVAQELISLGEKMYPGLFKPNIFYATDARYNQHLSDGALILEVGNQLNSIEEAKYSAELIADIVAEYLKMN